MYIAFERLGEPVLISKKIGLVAEGSDGSYQEQAELVYIKAYSALS